MIDLIGQTFKTVLYESVVGKVEVEYEILQDGSASTILWVIYPDGVGEEVFSIAEASEKLEL
jgi:hypothetical protein